MYPMFKSYVFFAGGENEQLIVSKTNRLVRLVEISHAEQATFRQEISSLELTLREAPEEIELYPQLATGKRVLISGGPMKGAEGIVMNSDNPTRLWIGITMMGAGATIEIHADLVEPLAEDFKERAATTQLEYHIDGRRVHSRQLRTRDFVPSITKP